MQSHKKKVEHEIDHQRNSPGQKEVPPRLPRPENANADGHREGETRDECLAYAPEDYAPWEVGVPVQKSGLRDEE
jgi:hypothetical protein